MHFDNGWNSAKRRSRIFWCIVDACGFDLYTYVIDGASSADLRDYSCWRRSSILASPLRTMGYLASTLGLSREHGVRYVLSGYNVATDTGCPRLAPWKKFDWTSIPVIHRVMVVNSRPFRISTFDWRLAQLAGRGIEIVRMSNMVSYRRDHAVATLKAEFGRQASRVSIRRDDQDAILPTKFGIDKRRVHLSDRIRNGELTRKEATEK